MKKLLALGSALVLAVSAMPAVLAEDTDAFTSASVSSYYGDFALTGDELMNAINSFSGTYLICTTNPDGTPNAGVFIFACVKNEDKYYIQMGLAENQTKQNLLRTDGWMAVMFAVIAVLVYIAGLMCSHLGAFRIATNLRLQSMNHSH